jgi:hypothetical protein
MFNYQSLSGQTVCNLACNSVTNLSLDQNGEATIDPFMILEGNYSQACQDLFQISLTYANGDVIIPYDQSIQVNCDNVGQFTIVIAVIENGIVGNQCWGQIIIEDIIGACEFEVSPGNYALNLDSNFGGPFADEIQLNGSPLNEVYYKLFEIESSDILTGDNIITFDGKASGNNGISTLDLVLMTKNLLSIEDRGPLEALIADVDRSGYLGLNDIIATRQAILGITTGLSEYIFLKSDFEFPSDFDYYDFGTDIYDFHFDGADVASIDFTFDAYFSGDVNLSGNLKSTQTSENRNSISLDYDNIDIIKGAEYEVSFEVNNIDKIAGLQMALKTNGIIINDIISDYSGLDLMTLQTADLMKLSYLPQEYSSNFKISLGFNALEDGKLSDFISLDNEVIEGLLVNSDLEEININLNANSVSSSNEIEVSSISAFPNPSNGNVTITLPKDDNYQVAIFTSTGRTVANFSHQGSVLTLDEMTLFNNGVYYITILASDKIYQARLIVE